MNKQYLCPVVSKDLHRDIAEVSVSMSPIKFPPNINRVVSPQCQSKRTNPREVTDAELKDMRGKKSHTTMFLGFFLCVMSV